MTRFTPRYLLSSSAIPAFTAKICIFDSRTYIVGLQCYHVQSYHVMGKPNSYLPGSPLLENMDAAHNQHSPPLITWITLKQSLVYTRNNKHLFHPKWCILYGTLPPSWGDLLRTASPVRTAPYWWHLLSTDLGIHPAGFVEQDVTLRWSEAWRGSMPLQRLTIHLCIVCSLCCSSIVKNHDELHGNIMKQIKMKSNDPPCEINAIITINHLPMIWIQTTIRSNHYPQSKSGIV